MVWSEGLDSLLANEAQAHLVAAMFVEILDGQAAPEQVGAFIAACRVGGERPDIVAALRDGLISRMIQVELADHVKDRAVDIVGTGGDGSNSVNISTGASLVVAACGVPVVKHGNRAASSSCGSADVLEALGIALDTHAAQVADDVEEFGFAFCFAPNFHPGLRHLAPIRRSLGIRSVLNILGPLANPAHVKRSVIGVATQSALELVAGAVASDPTMRSLVVHGAGAIDEISLAGPTDTADIDVGVVTRYLLDAADFQDDVGPTPIEALKGGDANDNAAALVTVFNGQLGAVRDAIVRNASAGLLIGGAASNLADGVVMARNAIDSGEVRRLLARLQSR